MDVFKTHVGEGKALMINEENFYLATRERKPYVVDSGGVKSFYAVLSRMRQSDSADRPAATPAGFPSPSPIWAAYRT